MEYPTGTRSYNVSVLRMNRSSLWTGSERMFGLSRQVFLALSVVVFAALQLRTRMRVMKIYGDSMEPSLHPGDRIIVNSRVNGLRVGDIVAFKAPPSLQDSSRVLVKRVAGLAGDTVATSQTELMPLRVAGDTAESENTKIPAGFVFVASEQPGGYDSHIFGPIPIDLIIGVVCYPTGI